MRAISPIHRLQTGEMVVIPCMSMSIPILDHRNTKKKSESFCDRSPDNREPGICTRSPDAFAGTSGIRVSFDAATTGTWFSDQHLIFSILKARDSTVRIILITAGLRIRMFWLLRDASRVFIATKASMSVGLLVACSWVFLAVFSLRVGN